MAFSVEFRNQRFSIGWMALWFLAEVIVFLAIVDRFGVGAALLAQLVSMIIGVVLLRRLGRKALVALRQGVPAGATDSSIADGLMAGLGAALFVAPGFLSTLAALALSVPALRGLLTKRFGKVLRQPAGRPPARGGGAVDLDPAEWRRGADSGPDMPTLPR